MIVPDEPQRDETEIARFGKQKHPYFAKGVTLNDDRWIAASGVEHHQLKG